MTPNPTVKPMEELKPCPFCGHWATTHYDETTDWWEAVCMGPTCVAGILGSMDKAEAIAAWNRRVSVQQEAGKVCMELNEGAEDSGAPDGVTNRCYNPRPCPIHDAKQEAGEALSGEGTCGLFHCPLDEARRLMPSIPWADAPLHAGVDYIVDVKVHKLMPGQWPCIPNWHCDFIPRDPETLVERPDLIDGDEEPMFMWLSGPPFTEFRDGREIPARTWIEFTQMDEHRGIVATEHCWRTFARIAPAPLVRAGLPREQVPAPPSERIRRHTQVYLDAERFKW